MNKEIEDILSILVDADLVDFKCFDILKEKLKDDNFRNFVKENIKKGLIKKFPRELFDAVCKQNIRAPFEPIKIFIEGANIGNCTIMSKLISYSLDSCYICGGTLEALRGTKNSPDGRHTWISVGRDIIDPSLMIVVDESIASMIGYTEENRYNPNLDQRYNAAKDYANDQEIRKKSTI